MYLDDDALRPFLGGLTEHTFLRGFGLDHEGLVEGGREIAAGGGDLGEALFAAGSGVANLRTVLGGFGFRGEAVERKVGDLSGGERTRRAYWQELHRPR